MAQRHAKRVDPSKTLKNEIEKCNGCTSVIVHQISHRPPPLACPSQVLLATYFGVTLAACERRRRCTPYNISMRGGRNA
jgi:hypothetical protein